MIAALALTLNAATGELAAGAAAINREVKRIDESAGKITLKHGRRRVRHGGIHGIYRVRTPLCSSR